MSDIVKKFGGEYFDAQMSWLEEEQNGVPFTRVDKDTSENEYAKLKEQFPDSATDERIRRDKNFHDEGWDSENLPIENAIYLNKKIQHLSQSHKKPIIIISHSKGDLYPVWRPTKKMTKERGSIR